MGVEEVVRGAGTGPIIDVRRTEARACGECVHREESTGMCIEWSRMVAPVQEACRRFLGNDGAGIDGFKPVMTVSIADHKWRKGTGKTANTGFSASKATPKPQTDRETPKDPATRTKPKRRRPRGRPMLSDDVVKRDTMEILKHRASGLNNAEVAKAMGVSSCTVAMRLREARVRGLVDIDGEVERLQAIEVARMYNDGVPYRDIPPKIRVGTRRFHDLMERAVTDGLIVERRRHTDDEIEEQISDVLRLRAKGLTDQQTADRMGIKVSMVRRRLQTARERGVKIPPRGVLKYVEETKGVVDVERVDKTQERARKPKMEPEVGVNKVDTGVVDLRTMSADELRDLYRAVMMEMGRRYAEEAV